MLCRAALAAALLVVGRSATAQDAPLPSSTLSVQVGNGWREFWSSSRAPITWHDATLDKLVKWQRGATGIEWGELLFHGSGEAWRTRVVIAKLDPSRLTLRLDTAFTPKREPAFTLGRLPASVVFAVNAGQFEATMPWGWVVLNGQRWLSPQSGPLAAALAQDSSGFFHWIVGPAVFKAASDLKPRWAFQSYPVVIANDTVPFPVRAPGRGLDLAHRDARTAVCIARNDRIIVVLTRFAASGSLLGPLPFGLTVPEMGAVMGALGCRDAMLLDGGISAKMRIVDSRGANHDWDGFRPVPLTLVAFPKEE